MHNLTWITSSRNSGANAAHLMVAGYLLDTPPGDITVETMLETAPDLSRLFNWGRMLPLEEKRPYAARVTGMPGEEILDPYREATGKVVYVVRNPRVLISHMVQNSKPEPGERERRAQELIASLGAMAKSPPSRGTWQQHVLEWTSPERARAYFPNLEDICVLRHEDMWNDPPAALSRMIDFLGVLGPVDDERVKRTLDTWTEKSLRQSELAPVLPGIEAFQEPRERPGGQRGPSGKRGPGGEGPPSLAELGAGVEEAYQRRLAEDAEFADLVRRFGYEE